MSIKTIDIDPNGKFSDRFSEFADALKEAVENESSVVLRFGLELPVELLQLAADHAITEYIKAAMETQTQLANLQVIAALRTSNIPPTTAMIQRKLAASMRQEMKQYQNSSEQQTNLNPQKKETN